MYEYILTLGILGKIDSPVTLSCIFRVCDSDRDGSITFPEIEKVFSILTMSQNSPGASDDSEDAADLKVVMDMVKGTFGGKTKVSEQEFVKMCTDNEQLTEFFQTIQIGLTLGVAYSGQNFTE